MGRGVITSSLVNSSSLRTVRLNVRRPEAGRTDTSGSFPTFSILLSSRPAAVRRRLFVKFLLNEVHDARPTPPSTPNTVLIFGAPRAVPDGTSLATARAAPRDGRRTLERRACERRKRARPFDARTRRGANHAPHRRLRQTAARLRDQRGADRPRSKLHLARRRL